MILRRLALLGGLCVAMASTIGPALAADNCVPQVHIVYFGSTAVNPTVNATGLDLFGTPLSTCSADIKTYQKMLDLNNDGTAETCTRLYVASSQGSCEGVEALDRKLNNFNVCTPTSGSTTQVLLSTINDENGQPLFANFAGSDVGASECSPVIQGCTISRPNIFTDTEARPFVIPFGLVVNNGIRAFLREGEGKETLPAVQCVHGAGQCVDLKIGMTDRQGKSAWGADSLCDWRDVSPMFHSASGVAIGSILRNARSGTRRAFNSQFLQNFAVAPGNWFTTGSGNMVTRVNNNQNCINPPGPVPAGEGCGETPTSCGVYTWGGGLDNCRNVSLTNYLTVGQLGTDRFNVSDHGTPANPFDDVPIRATASDQYDILRYNGTDFSKANVECGFYEYWTFERFYYDNVYMAPGSFREAAIQKIFSRAGVLAGNDPAVVSASQMFVSRAQDGEPIFTTGPHNSFCTIP